MFRFSFRHFPALSCNIIRDAATRQYRDTFVYFADFRLGSKVTYFPLKKFIFSLVTSLIIITFNYKFNFSFTFHTAQKLGEISRVTRHQPHNYNNKINLIFLSHSSEIGRDFEGKKAIRNRAVENYYFTV